MTAAGAAGDPREGAMPRAPRSALVTLTQATLALEALVALFATLVVWGLGHSSGVSVGDAQVGSGTVWAVGGTLTLVFMVAAGMASRRWGRLLGWAAQVALIACGVAELAVAVVGVMFVVIYALGVRLGSRIDRERAERAASEGVTT